MRGDLCNELLASDALLSQVYVDLRAPAAPSLLASDASTSAEASVVAGLPEALSLELTRHGLQRGLWSFRRPKPISGSGESSKREMECRRSVTARTPFGRSSGRTHPGCRYVHLQDSQVALATFIKGRSSSPSLNRELRRSLASYIASRVRPSFGHIPTRGAALRGPSKVCAPLERERGLCPPGDACHG